MKVKVKKLHPDAKLPVYATDGAGCFDLHALESEFDILTSSLPVKVSTGLSFEIPEGYVMLVFSRSGHGFKHGIRLSNCVGVIDSDYRGEVKVKLHKDSTLLNQVFRVNKGDRIAQAMIVPIPKIEFVEVDELSDTERGDSGFGSTGMGGES